METKSYSEKLKDPRWQKKRLEIMQRDGFKCKLCKDEKSPLNVHHTKYDKGELWDVDSCYLITLCETCHQYVHEVIDLGSLHWINRQAELSNHNKSELIIAMVLLMQMQKTNDDILRKLIDDYGRLD